MKLLLPLLSLLVALKISCVKAAPKVVELIDERDLDRESEGSWRCPDTDEEEFIKSSQLCDGRRDCTNGADEGLMQCGKEAHPCEFECANSSVCVLNDRVCDGVSDCSDGSDEADCELRCPEFACAMSDMECVADEYVCDGDEDCTDGSDEMHCDVPGSTSQSLTTTPETSTNTRPATTTRPPTTFTTASSTMVASLSAKNMKKCKKNPSKPFCKVVHSLLAEKHLSKKLISKCVKKPKKHVNKCRNWQPVIQLKLESNPKDVIPGVCYKKPKKAFCRQFYKILSAELVSDEMREKCSKHKKRRFCRKHKVLLDFRDSL